MASITQLKYVFAVALFFGIVSIVGLVTLATIWHKKLTPFLDFAVVVDAGSTHSKIFVYQ